MVCTFTILRSLYLSLPASLLHTYIKLVARRCVFIGHPLISPDSKLRTGKDFIKILTVAITLDGVGCAHDFFNSLDVLRGMLDLPVAPTWSRYGSPAVPDMGIMSAP